MNLTHIVMSANYCPACGSSYDQKHIHSKYPVEKSNASKIFCREIKACNNCDHFLSKGYIALIECDPELSGLDENGVSVTSVMDVYRKGRTMFVHPTHWDKAFKLPAPSTQLASVTTEAFEKVWRIVDG